MSTGEQAPPGEKAPIEERAVAGLKRRRERFHEHGRIYRYTFVAAGFVVLLAGLLAVVLPGPATILIPIGLAILSLQFAWAGKLLDQALEYARKARAGASTIQISERRRTMLILAAVLAAAAVAALVLYLL